MSDPPVTLRQLNRATLERQQLLARGAGGATGMIERLGGLQAQAPVAPFVGLWTRLEGFSREALADLVAARKVVKATWVRATLHLISSSDYHHFRSTLQPMLSAGWAAITRQRRFDLDLAELLAAARDHLAEEPRTFAELSDWLGQRFPGQDVGAMRYAVRTHLPLVQIPVAGGWSYPARPRFTLAEAWLGAPPAPEETPEELVLRYLGAFGPASARDAQTWSGLPGLDAVFTALEPRLRRYRDGRRTLYDLADRDLPDEAMPAPVRYLPEYDNLLLSHSVRRRVLADEHRSRVYLPGLRVRSTFLVDGFVAGAWSVEKTRSEAALVLEPFLELGAAERRELEREGEGLLGFLEPKAKRRAIRFT